MANLCISMEKKLDLLKGKIRMFAQPRKIDILSHNLKYGQVGSALCDRWLFTSMDYRFNCFNFQGRISQVRIWTTALSHETLCDNLWNFNPPEDLLVALWCFAKGSVVVYVLKTDQTFSREEDNDLKTFLVDQSGHGSLLRLHQVQLANTETEE